MSEASIQTQVKNHCRFSNVVVIVPNEDEWAVSYCRHCTVQMQNWEQYLLRFGDDGDGGPTPNLSFRIEDLKETSPPAEKDIVPPSAVLLQRILSTVRSLIDNVSEGDEAGEEWTMVYILKEKKLHPKIEVTLHKISEEAGFQTFILWPSLLYALHWRFKTQSEATPYFCCLVPIRCDSSRIYWDKSVITKKGEIWKDDVYSSGENDIPSAAGARMLLGGVAKDSFPDYPVDFIVYNIPILDTIVCAIEAIATKQVTIHTEVYTDADFHYVDGNKVYTSDTPTSFKISGKTDSFPLPVGTSQFEFYSDGCLKSLMIDSPGGETESHPLCILPEQDLCDINIPNVTAQQKIFSLEELLVLRPKHNHPLPTEADKSHQDISSYAEESVSLEGVSEIISLESNALQSNEKESGREVESQLSSLPPVDAPTSDTLPTNEAIRIDRGSAGVMSLDSAPAGTMSVKKRPPAILRFWKKRVTRIQKAVQVAYKTSQEMLFHKKLNRKKKVTKSSETEQDSSTKLVTA